MKGSWADARNIWALPGDLSPDYEACRALACVGSDNAGRLPVRRLSSEES